MLAITFNDGLTLVGSYGIDAHAKRRERAFEFVPERALEREVGRRQLRTKQ